MTKFVFRAVRARQSPAHHVLSFTAKSSEVLAFAEIHRAGRSKEGKLTGFQRPQIAGHVREIREYLSYPNAVLPNPIVIAFTEGVSVREVDDATVELRIDASRSKPGFVVDGQQRLTALSGLPDKDFQIFVSALICESQEDLRRQFVLINNTRPLPKALIYELLPSVTELPDRLASRSMAASLTERLNYDAASSLKGQIYQHTNPRGVIRDTAIQKVIMTSISDGALREVVTMPSGLPSAFQVVSDFYEAVQRTFGAEWEDHTAKTSRLVHGAGIRAMGYVMDLLWERDGARSSTAFSEGLKCLEGKTAWTSGAWKFGPQEIVPWKEVQNIDRQILKLAQHLVGIVKRSPRNENESRRGKNGKRKL